MARGTQEPAVEVDIVEDEPTTSQAATATVTKQKQPHSAASAISGAVSGIVIGACLQPLDVVHTRMQGDSMGGFSRSMIATGQSILGQHGVRGLWRGTGPTVIRLGLGVGLHMVLVENLKSGLSKQLDGGLFHLSSFNALLSGGIARALASTLLCPVTVVKTRMEYGGAGAVRYKDTWDALSSIARAEGPRGLFRGLVPTVMTTAPFSGLYYMFYLRLKEVLAAEGRPQFVVNLASGTVASVAATLLTQPFDVVRTRVQLSTAAAGGTSAASLAAAPMAILRQAMSQGPTALFIGTLPRVLKRTGQTALVWTLYEELVPGLTAAYVGAAAMIAAHSSSNSSKT